MEFGAFTRLRFSRLYPLHLATLLALVPLILVFHALTGDDFIYKYNDAYHFGLNLAFVQYWGFEKGLSWNGPSWSISVEIALYLIFFAVCRLLAPTVLQTICLILASLALAHFWPIAAGGIAFFAGGLTYHGFKRAQRRRRIWASALAVAATILIWRLFGSLTDGEVARQTAEAAGRVIPSGPIESLLLRGYLIFCGRARELALFPSLIFTFALLESATPRLPWHALGGVGNISFGVLSASFSHANGPHDHRLDVSLARRRLYMADHFHRVFRLSVAWRMRKLSLSGAAGDGGREASKKPIGPSSRQQH